MIQATPNSDITKQGVRVLGYNECRQKILETQFATAGTPREIAVEKVTSLTLFKKLRNGSHQSHRMSQ